MKPGTTGTTVTHTHALCEATAGDLDLLGRLVDVQAFVVLDRDFGLHHGDCDSAPLGVEMHHAGAGVDRDDLERSRLEGPHAGVLVAILAGLLVETNLSRRYKLRTESRNSSRSFVVFQEIKRMASNRRIMLARMAIYGLGEGRGRVM